MLNARLITDFSVMSPAINAESMGTHYDQHYLRYVAEANNLLAGTVLSKLSLEELLTILNWNGPLGQYCCQIFNHEFFFEQFTGKRGNYDLPYNYRHFYQSIVEHSANIFGSGYIWVISRGEEFMVVTTASAVNPLKNLTKGDKLILCIDCWEHAYYKQYDANRKAYIEECLNAVDWDIIKQRMCE